MPEPEELLEKATTMLSYCKSILGEKAGPDHFVLVVAAINILGTRTLRRRRGSSKTIGVS
jgi:hypothetical protein